MNKLRHGTTFDPNEGLILGANIPSSSSSSTASNTPTSSNNSNNTQQRQQQQNQHSSYPSHLSSLGNLQNMMSGPSSQMPQPLPQIPSKLQGQTLSFSHPIQMHTLPQLSQQQQQQQQQQHHHQQGNGGNVNGGIVGPVVMGSINQMNQSNQMNQMGQMGHNSHMNHMNSMGSMGSMSSQMNMMNSMSSMGHMGQMGHMQLNQSIPPVSQIQPFITSQSLHSHSHPHSHSHSSHLSQSQSSQASSSQNQLSSQGSNPNLNQAVQKVEMLAPHSSPKRDEGSPTAMKKEGGPGRIKIENLKTQQHLVMKWLKSNYEQCPDVSLPRDSFYNYYKEKCLEDSVDPVHVSTFGKMLRMVFPSVSSRRLGVRGRSKYHYHGIKVKESSPLMAKEQQRVKEEHQRMASESKKNKETISSLSNFSFHSQVSINFPPFNGPSELQSLASDYTKHCEEIFEIVCKETLSEALGKIEDACSTFWQDFGEEGEDCLSSPDLVDYVYICDVVLYSCILDESFPNILRSVPLEVTQLIRNLGKNIEKTICKSIATINSSLLQKAKQQAVQGFAKVLKSGTALNHLSQAARAVVEDHSQVLSMLNDWDMLDLKSIHDQIKTVSSVDVAPFSRFEDQFRMALQRKFSLEDFATIIEKVIGTFFVGADQYTKSKEISLLWAYYWSTIIRDLTLISAMSFGSFHLIRLFCEEFANYIINCRIASSQKKIPEYKNSWIFVESVNLSLFISLYQTDYFLRRVQPEFRAIEQDRIMDVPMNLRPLNIPLNIMSYSQAPRA